MKPITKNDPIQFLPIKHWWTDPTPAQRVQRAFVWGLICGVAAALASAAIIWLIS